MSSDRSLREHVLRLLRGRGAHAPLDALLDRWPVALRGVRPEGQPHTAWRLLEHLRIAAEDILEFSRDADWASPPWPEGYWPAEDAPPDARAWSRARASLRSVMEAMEALVEDPANDLLAPFPWADGATLLREALLVADHNAYHGGQLAVLRRLLGLPPARLA